MKVEINLICENQIRIRLKTNWCRLLLLTGGHN